MFTLALPVAFLLIFATVFRDQTALLDAYNPYSGGSGFSGGDLLIVGAWGAAGLLLALRWFRWTPQSS